ncbi:uncharacterized protein LOC113555473 [Rhopalosiphum maidis]|uniref:uncharacterized protein LOC113555473 n=1 Tax=Rhopalosiphum maidis TaxID=43146 RepID=UPI000EFE794F|nr:uncharacterized protein LOC113555473 [Rhopalosiphum maidis]
MMENRRTKGNYSDDEEETEDEQGNNKEHNETVEGDFVDANEKSMCASSEKALTNLKTIKKRKKQIILIFEEELLKSLNSQKEEESDPDKLF